MTERGTGLLELLVGIALGLLAFAATLSTVRAGVRLLVTLGTRSTAEDTVQAAAEAFAFDVRRAGYDPTASGLVAVGAARPDRLTLHADLDGDGTLDPASGEVTTWACRPAQLSRVVGHQSMPLADDVGRCRFRYLDGAGGELGAPPGGLAAADRARIRATVLELVAGGAARTLGVALRTAP